ncbi:MAG: hypothetical protein H6849_04720 [Alphaproteobacteria bacterium]|nr:MAG: hypothetical protein H6849_04720 [Alphaproteobacteria bacterium]
MSPGLFLSLILVFSQSSFLNSSNLCDSKTSSTKRKRDNLPLSHDRVDSYSSRTRLKTAHENSCHVLKDCSNYTTVKRSIFSNKLAQNTPKPLQAETGNENSPCHALASSPTPVSGQTSLLASVYLPLTEEEKSEKTFSSNLSFLSPAKRKPLQYAQSLFEHICGEIPIKPSFSSPLVSRRNPESRKFQQSSNQRILFEHYTNFLHILKIEAREVVRHSSYVTESDEGLRTRTFNLAQSWMKFTDDAAVTATLSHIVYPESAIPLFSPLTHTHLKGKFTEKFPEILVLNLLRRDGLLHFRKKDRIISDSHARSMHALIEKNESIIESETYAFGKDTLVYAARKEIMPLMIPGIINKDWIKEQQRDWVDAFQKYEKEISVDGIFISRRKVERKFARNLLSFCLHTTATNKDQSLEFYFPLALFLDPDTDYTAQIYLLRQTLSSGRAPKNIFPDGSEEVGHAHHVCQANFSSIVILPSSLHRKSIHPYSSTPSAIDRTMFDGIRKVAYQTFGRMLITQEKTTSHSVPTYLLSSHLPGETNLEDQPAGSFFAKIQVAAEAPTHARTFMHSDDHQA